MSVCVCVRLWHNWSFAYSHTCRTETADLLKMTKCLFADMMTHLHGAHSTLALPPYSQRKRKTPGMTRTRGEAARLLTEARWSCSWRCSLDHGGLLRTENKRRSGEVSQRVLYHLIRTTNLLSFTLHTVRVWGLWKTERFTGICNVDPTVLVHSVCWQLLFEWCCKDIFF